MHTCKVLIEYSAPSPSLTLLFIRFYRGAGINCWQSTGLVIQRLRVRLPAGAAGYFFFPSLELTLCADSHSVSVPPRVTAVARKRPRSLCQKCRWPVTPKHAHTLDPTKSEWADYAVQSMSKTLYTVYKVFVIINKHREVNRARQTRDTTTMTWIACGNSTWRASKYKVYKFRHR